MKLRLLLVALPFTPIGSLLAATTNDIPLAERVMPALDPILRSAAQQSPRMISRSLDLEIAEQNRILARAGLLPNAGGSYRYLRASDDRADPGLTSRLDSTKVYYDFSINQPLYHWGERRNTARIGEIQKQIAEGNYREGYRLLAQEIRLKYLTLIVQKTQLLRARTYLKFAQQQLQFAEDRLAKKVISDLEIYPVRLNVEQGQITLERTELDYESSKHTFARLAGIGEITDAQIPDALPVLSYPEQSFQHLLADFLAQKEYPAVEAANLRKLIEIERLNVQNQKTRLRPKFGLVAGISQDQQSYSLNTTQIYRVQSINGGLTMNWTIFDGFAARAGKRISLARQRQLEGDYAELNDRLARLAQSQLKQINFAARSMAISDRGLTSGEGNLRAKTEEFRRGVVSEADVSVAELHLLDARINGYSSRIDYLSKVGDFLGTLNEDPVVAGVSTLK